MSEDIRIEYPSQGMTYCRNEYGVYRYGIYPKSSILKGLERRSFLASFKTLDEARMAYPEAHEAGCGYTELDLSFLPDEKDEY